MNKNVIKTNSQYEYAFTTVGYCRDNNTLYGITNDGYFISIDCTNYSLRYLYPINATTELYFSSIYSISVGDKIFFFSFDGTGYYIYSIMSNKLIYKITPGIVPTSSLERANTILVTYINECIYVLVRNANEIIIINSGSGEISNRLKLNIDLNHAWAVTHKNRIYLFLNDSNSIKEINPGSCEIRDISNNIKFSDLQSVCSDEESIYILTNNGKIYLYDLNQCIQKYEINGSNKDFSLIVKAMDNIWVFPWLADSIFCIEDDRIQQFDEYDGDFQYGASDYWYTIGAKYVNYVPTNDGIVFPPRVGNKLAIIDAEGKLKWKDIIVPESNEMLKARIWKHGFVKEEAQAEKLQDLINMIGS